MLKQWKENFVNAQRKHAAYERRVVKAERMMQQREDEMLEWARTQVASREMLLSGQY